MQLQPWRGRLVVLLGIVLAALNLRIAVASVSPILGLVREDVALSAAQVGLLGTIPVASFALFGSLATPLARRIGLEPAIVVAMAVSATGEALRATAGSAPTFLGWSVAALAGLGMGNVLLPPLVKRYFPDRIGAVTAAYSVALPISTALPPLVAVPLAQSAGWRVAVGVWAVLGVVAVVPWLVVIVRSAHARARLRNLLRRAPASDAPDVLGARPVDPRLVWGSPHAWALAVMFGMNALGTYATFAWLPELLVADGYPAEVGGRWLALFAILGLPASFVLPVLAQRVRNPFWVVFGFCVVWACGYLGLILSPHAGLPLWMVLLGIGPGSFPLFLALIGLRSADASVAVTLSGMVQGVGYALAGLGPIGVGLVVERTGSWDLALWLLLGTLVVLVAAAWRACRPGLIGARPAPERGSQAADPVA